MKKSEQFSVVELGTTYHLSKYRVVDGKGIQLVKDIYNEYQDGRSPLDTDVNQKITLVRGDKSDGGVVIPRVDGVLHEQLLGMMIEDMRYKNSLVPSRESAIVITKLEEALMWLEKRQYDRENRNVVGTYQK